MPRKYVEVDGFAVNYFHTGRTTLPTVPPDLTRGRVMVYVHGAGGNGEYGRKFLDVLAEDHSPLALDFPGHGRSGGTESLGSVPAYGDFLDAFVRTLGLRPVVLVGHSMGGAVAIDFTLRHPEAVDALVLVATAARFAVSPQRLRTWRGPGGAGRARSRPPRACRQRVPRRCDRAPKLESWEPSSCFERARAVGMT